MILWPQWLQILLTSPRIKTDYDEFKGLSKNQQDIYRMS